MPKTFIRNSHDRCPCCLTPEGGDIKIHPVEGDLVLTIACPLCSPGQGAYGHGDAQQYGVVPSDSVNDVIEEALITVLNGFSSGCEKALDESERARQRNT